MKNNEEFWAGEFGNEYHKRSPGDVKANIDFFRKALPDPYPASLIEFGSGAGNNLRAIAEIVPSIELASVELNTEALKLQPAEVDQFQASMLDFKPLKTYEVSMTKGVLIHVHPDDLSKAYQTLYDSSHKWVLICEYFSHNPRMIPYRGENDKLWARDFCKEIMTQYPDLELTQYGFTYHLDGQDDLTFFLMRKP